MALMKHAQEEAERSIALAAQLNVKELQIKRMEQQLMDARRQLSKYSPDPESISINHNHQIGVMNHGCEEGDSSRGVDPSRISEREAMTDFLLGEGENDCIVIDSDSISLVSNQMHMGSCESDCSRWHVDHYLVITFLLQIRITVQVFHRHPTMQCISSKPTGTTKSEFDVICCKQFKLKN